MVRSRGLQVELEQRAGRLLKAWFDPNCGRIKPDALASVGLVQAQWGGHSGRSSPGDARFVSRICTADALVPRELQAVRAWLVQWRGTPQQRRILKALYAPTRIGYRVIGEREGVCSRTVQRVQIGAIEMLVNYLYDETGARRVDSLGAEGAYES